MRFTEEELAVLYGMLRDHLKGQLAPERRVLLMGVLVQVHENLLLGTSVTFERDSKEVVGVLEGFEDWEGVPLACLVFEGLHTRRLLTQIPELSSLANEMDEHRKLKETLQ